MSGLKLKVMPQFPAQLIGGAGIDVVKANGIYTLDLDFTDFPQVSAVPPGVTYALIFNPTTGTYSQLPISLLGGGGGGAVSSVFGRTGAVAAAANDYAFAQIGATPTTVAGYGITDAVTEAPNDGQLYGRQSHAWAVVAGGAAAPPQSQGRLTINSGTPVLGTPGNISATLIFTPYGGNIIPLFNGTSLVATAFPELNCLNTDTTKNPSPIGASKVNDWFVWLDTGAVLRLSHGPDWTSDTARSAGTALVMVNGVLVNSVAITNGPAAQRGTYVGTTRSNSANNFPYQFGGSANGGAAGFFGIWNMYNRVMVSSTVTDSSGAYPYSGGTRQAHASAGNQISFVVGLVEDGFTAFGSMCATTSAVLSSGGSFGVGLNSTTTYAFQTVGVATPVAAAFTGAGTSGGAATPALGLNVVSLNENGDGTNTTQFDVQGRNSLGVVMRL
jgi:hypothetical protein